MHLWSSGLGNCLLSSFRWVRVLLGVLWEMEISLWRGNTFLRGGNTQSGGASPLKTVGHVVVSCNFLFLINLYLHVGIDIWNRKTQVNVTVARLDSEHGMKIFFEIAIDKLLNSRQAGVQDRWEAMKDTTNALALS